MNAALRYGNVAQPYGEGYLGKVGACCCKYEDNHGMHIEVHRLRYRKARHENSYDAYSQVNNDRVFGERGSFIKVIRDACEKAA